MEKTATPQIVVHREIIRWGEELKVIKESQTPIQMGAVWGIAFALDQPIAAYKHTPLITLSVDNDRILSEIPAFLFEITPFHSYTDIHFKFNKTLDKPADIYVAAERSEAAKTLYNTLSVFVFGYKN